MNSHLTTDLIVDYLHGELPPAEDALAYAHLKACSECRTEYERETALTQMLRTAAAAEECEMPSLVAARVWERIRAAQPTPLQKLAAFLRPAIAVPVAAVLLVGGFFASPLAHHAAQPTIDVSYYLEMHAAQQAQNPFSEHSPSATVLETTSYEDAGSRPTLADSSMAGVAATDNFDAVR